MPKRLGQLGLWSAHRLEPSSLVPTAVSYTHLDVYKRQRFWRMTATIDGRAEAVSAEMISGNYYSALGVQPALGRAIGEPDDGEPGSGPAVSYTHLLAKPRSLSQHVHRHRRPSE